MRQSFWTIGGIRRLKVLYVNTDVVRVHPLVGVWSIRVVFVNVLSSRLLDE